MIQQNIEKLELLRKIAEGHLIGCRVTETEEEVTCILLDPTAYGFGGFRCEFSVGKIHAYTHVIEGMDYLYNSENKHMSFFKTINSFEVFNG